MAKDNRWLQVEVCREYLRQSCSRPEDECRFAHPPSNVDVVNGRVVACFDNIKGRCHRDSCRYLHPPRHIKEQLENAGKSHSAALANGTNGHSVQAIQSDSYLTQNSSSWPGALSQYAGSPVLGPPSSLATTAQGGGRRADKSDRLEACREFLRGTCNRSENECRFSHPPEHISVDSSDSTVTVCMDFMKDRCSRETCRYFHPPPHLKQRVRQQQQQHQATVGATSPTHPLGEFASTVHEEEKAITLGLEQLRLAGGTEEAEQNQTVPAHVAPQPSPYGTCQAPLASLPVAIPGALMDAGGLASVVNSNVMALQQQPSVVKYQEMMAGYASRPDSSAMSESFYPLGLHPGQEIVPGNHPNYMPPAVPYYGYIPMAYCVPCPPVGPVPWVYGEMPFGMPQLRM